MTFEQVYVINRALDGRDIYSMPSFAGLEMTEASVMLHKDELIRIGILESYSSFTANGAQIAQNISDFKKAGKYVSLFDIVLGSSYPTVANGTGCTAYGTARTLLTKYMKSIASLTTA